MEPIVFWSFVSLSGFWMVVLTLIVARVRSLLLQRSPDVRKVAIEAMQEAFIEQNERLERWKQALELEWANALDKVNSMAGRVSKRHGLMEAALQKEEEKRAGASGPLSNSDRESRRRQLRQRMRH